MVGGPGPHGYTTIGGMFNLLQVRDQLPADGTEPGWYLSTPGTQADAATVEELRRDGCALATAKAQLETRGSRIEWCDPTSLAATPVPRSSRMPASKSPCDEPGRERNADLSDNGKLPFFASSS